MNNWRHKKYLKLFNERALQESKEKALQKIENLRKIDIKDSKKCSICYDIKDENVICTQCLQHVCLECYSENRRKQSRPCAAGLFCKKCDNISFTLM